MHPRNNGNRPWLNSPQPPHCPEPLHEFAAHQSAHDVQPSGPHSLLQPFQTIGLGKQMQGKQRQRGAQGPHGPQQHPLLKANDEIIKVQSQRAIMAKLPSAKPGGNHRASERESRDWCLSIGRQSWPNRENRCIRQILPR